MPASPAPLFNFQPFQSYHRVVIGVKAGCRSNRLGGDPYAAERGCRKNAAALDTDTDSDPDHLGQDAAEACGQGDAGTFCYEGAWVRVDRILAGGARRVEDCRVLAEDSPDHYPVVTDLRLE